MKPYKYQANYISVNIYTPTSALYMVTHNTVHMYKHVHYICDVQGTMTIPTQFPLYLQRSHNNIQANPISVNTLPLLPCTWHYTLLYACTLHSGRYSLPGHNNHTHLIPSAPIEAIAIYRLIQLVQTHTHFRPVHGIISMYMALGYNSILWAQITTLSW